MDHGKAPRHNGWMPDAPEPRHFAVQRALAKSWQTLVLKPREGEAASLFAEAVRLRPRHVLRLIQVDYKPGSTTGEFDWKLIELYDPRKLGLVPDLAPEGEAKPAPKRAPRQKEKVRAPVRLYALFFALGVVAVAAGWFLLAER